MAIPKGSLLKLTEVRTTRTINNGKRYREAVKFEAAVARVSFASEKYDRVCVVLLLQKKKEKEERKKREGEGAGEGGGPFP